MVYKLIPVSAEISFAMRSFAKRTIICRFPTVTIILKIEAFQKWNSLDIECRTEKGQLNKSVRFKSIRNSYGTVREQSSDFYAPWNSQKNSKLYCGALQEPCHVVLMFFFASNGINYASFFVSILIQSATNFKNLN